MLFVRAILAGIFCLACSDNGDAIAASGDSEQHAQYDTLLPVRDDTPELAGNGAASSAPDDSMALAPGNGDSVSRGSKKMERFSSATEKVKTEKARSVSDTTGKEAKTVRVPYRHQVRIGFDLARVGFNFMFPSRVGFEFQGDYALRKNSVYLAAEAGYGRGNIDYSFLKYTTRSSFVRLGVEKSFLDKIGTEDFDIGFLGFRYGIAGGSYGEAEFSVSSPFGGSATGKEPGRNFVVHWGEIVGGIKVEVWRGIFLGWTVRGKFLFNPKQFQSISPNYIAGYGKGDRTSVFDFNFYLSYALRWTK